MPSIRRYTALLLALLTLVISSRASVHGHFCGKQLQDVQFMSQAASCGMDLKKSCDPAEKISSSSCCKDTHFQVKSQDLKSGFQFTSKAFNSPVIIAFQVLFAWTPDFSETLLHFIPPPPGLPKASLQILLGVFRI